MEGGRWGIGGEDYGGGGEDDWGCFGCGFKIVVKRRRRSNKFVLFLIVIDYRKGSLVSSVLLKD